MVERMIAVAAAPGSDRQSRRPQWPARRQADAERSNHRTRQRAARIGSRPSLDTGPQYGHTYDDVAAGPLAAPDAARSRAKRYIPGRPERALFRDAAVIAGLGGRRPSQYKHCCAAPSFPLALRRRMIARMSPSAKPFVNMDALRMSKYRMLLTASKAERDLGKRRPLYGGARRCPSVGLRARILQALSCGPVSFKKSRWKP